MASPSSSKAGLGPGDAGRAREPGGSLPLSEAAARDGASTRSLWAELKALQAARFADTAQLTRPAPDAASWAATLPWGRKRRAVPPARDEEPLFTLETAMLVARRNNRVCPRPRRWEELYALLPARKTLRGPARPPAPPTGATWAATPPLTKRLCFREHIAWAQRAGMLDAVMAFLQTMSEEDWLHMGED